MDPTLYKDFKTSRGLNYHYLVVPPLRDQPYLLFLHGFPSTSYDWCHQVAYFKDLGYGLIVPDMLGYGGTSIATDVELYRKSLISKDIIELLDAEGVGKQCIVIGHDWGSGITSRLADLYEDRFIAFALLAVGYSPPRPVFDLEKLLEYTKKVAGYELFGYWKFFSAPDAPDLIEKNFDSFFSILYPEDASLWISDMAPTGTLRAWIESGKTTAIGSWITDEERKIHSDELRKGGLAGPVCWYKITTSGIQSDDDKDVPVRSPAVSKPVFFGATKRDAICLPKLQTPATTQACSNVTVREFDSGHWVQLERKDEVNKELGSWFETVLASAFL